MDKSGMDGLENVFKQWNQISGRLHAQLAPIMEAQHALRPVYELQKTFGTRLSSLLEQQMALQRAFKGIKISDQRLEISHFAELTKQYQASLNAIIAPAFEELRSSLQELTPKIQKALLLLASYGWYFDFNMPLPSLWEVIKAIASDNINKAEESLIEHFESQLDEIESFFSSKFPHRLHIISSAFKAHRNGEYLLSIPVLLAQTDGICKEMANQYFFMKKDKKPRTAIYVEQVTASAYRAALLSPLTTSDPIGASESEREEGFNLLNRHLVMHGESLDYGSRVNALKAISLVNYVSQVLKIDAGYSY